MHLGRRILIGATALALPASLTVVGFSGVASAASAAPNPTTCKIASPSISFNPPLTAKGVADPSKASESTRLSISFTSCSNGTPAPIAVTIATKPSKDLLAPGDGNPKGTLLLGTCSFPESIATLKSIGHSLKNLAITGGTLKVWRVAFASGGPLEGWIISGTVKGGTNSTANHGVTLNLLASLSSPSNTNWYNGCHSGPVSSINVDTVNSSATL